MPCCLYCVATTKQQVDTTQDQVNTTQDQVDTTQDQVDTTEHQVDTTEHDSVPPALPAVTSNTSDTALSVTSPPAFSSTSVPTASSTTSFPAFCSGYTMDSRSKSVPSPTTDLSLPQGDSLTVPDSLQESLPSQRLTEGEDILKQLATQLHNWKMLGRYLMLDDTSLDRISSMYMFPSEQAIQMLRAWINQSADPSYQVLGDALHNCLKDDLVLELVRYTRHKKAKGLSESRAGEVGGVTELSSLWSDLQPFMDSFTRRGYNRVSVHMVFHK